MDNKAAGKKSRIYPIAKTYIGLFCYLWRNNIALGFLNSTVCFGHHTENYSPFFNKNSIMVPYRTIS